MGGMRERGGGGVHATEIFWEMRCGFPVRINRGSWFPHNGSTVWCSIFILSRWVAWSVFWCLGIKSLDTNTTLVFIFNSFIYFDTCCWQHAAEGSVTSIMFEMQNLSAQLFLHFYAGIFLYFAQISVVWRSAGFTGSPETSSVAPRVNCHQTLADWFMWCSRSMLLLD